MVIKLKSDVIRLDLMKQLLVLHSVVIEAAFCFVKEG